MNVIVKRAVLYYSDKYPQAKVALLAWLAEILKGDFENFNQIKAVYGTAGVVANNRVVFNIRDNHFRLVVSFNFQQAAAYIIWFGTHKEYDNIDVEEIAFDRSILHYNPSMK